MRNVIFDIESDAVDRELTTVVHCLVLRDLETGEVVSCADQPGYTPIAEGVRLLEKAHRIYGHNVITYDIPVLQKHYPGFTPPKVFDTLVAVRVMFADAKEEDWNRFRSGRLPGNLIGTQGLKAWGYRLGLKKGEFEGPWDKWTDDMHDYCELDTEVTWKLVKFLLASPRWAPQALVMEHWLAGYLWQQQLNGWPFDVEGAQKLQAKLAGLREVQAEKLKVAFGFHLKRGKVLTPKVNNSRYHYTKGAACTKIEWVQFNPGSRVHIANELIRRYGWQPIEFTPKGRPQVNEKTLSGLKYPEAAIMNEFLMLDKRISSIAEGKEGWLRHVVDGKVPRIHHACIHNGTITHRAAHKKPNLGQVVSVDHAWGPECRALFGTWPGWVMVGSDASGLELRMLAHFMARYDKGAYGDIILSGEDIHLVNMAALGFSAKPMTKTWVYAYLYGAGNTLLGTNAKPGLPEDRAKTLGKRLRKKFESNLPAIGALVAAVQKVAKDRGWFKCFDGRRVYVRHQHAALNTLLQTSGSLSVKWWIFLAMRAIEKKYGRQGWDGQWAALGYIHDELQVASRPEIAEDIAHILVSTIPRVGRRFKLRLPLAAESKIGSNWAETH